MSKEDAYQEHLTLWIELFQDADEPTRKAADGMVKKAAYLHSLCWELEQVINQSGVIKVHPDHPDMQKQVLAVKEYTRIADSYANVANRLNQMRLKNAAGEGDELEEFE